MARVATYVFMDLETTGLPKEELNKTRITEISMMAVKRQHLLETRRGKTPRVRHNLTLCLNPGRMIQPTCSEVTGLCNDLLEHESLFNLEVYTMICSFLNILTKPVCLVAQNGLNFDFPILKAHVEKLGMSLPQDLVCADCYFAFYHILERPLTVENEVTVTDSSNKVTSINCENKPEPSTSEQDDVVFSMQKANESTPKTKPNLTLKTIRKANSSKVRRRFPWGEGLKPKESYKLAQIYERILQRPSIDAHRAENDCMMALELAVALSKEFVEYVDNNHYLFSNIAPMTVGVPLGHFTAPTYWEPELKN